MKKIWKYVCLIFILILFLTILMGCSNKDTDVALQYGKYSCKAEEIGFASVEIKEDYAMFCFSMLSSYIITGDYVIEKDKLVITDSFAPDNKYIFKIEEDTLTFLPKKSAKLPSYNDVDWKNVVFTRTDESK